MPCYDSRTSEENVIQHAKIQSLTAMLCAACKLLQERNVALPRDIYYWYNQHLKADAKHKEEDGWDE